MLFYVRYLGVVWGVVLDDPVHLRDVQPSSCHVSTQQDPRVRVAELEEGGGAFGLLLLALRNRGRNSLYNSWLYHTQLNDARRRVTRLTWMAMTGRSM